MKAVSDRMHRTLALCCAVLIGYNSEAFKLFPTHHRQITIVKYQEHSHQLTSSVLLSSSSSSSNQQLISRHYLPSSSPTTLSMSTASDTMAAVARRPFRIRTITSFVTLRPENMSNYCGNLR